MSLRAQLTIKYSDGGVITDFSQEAHDFKRDPFTVTLTTDDFIYIGFRKSITAIYASLTAVNTITSSLSAEYFRDDSVWAALEICDDTKAFVRSGFINWDRPVDALATTIDGDELCWVRIAANDNIDPVTFQAINVVFSDDNDICQIVPGLVDPCFFVSGETSHILMHVAAKNHIMSRLRSLGYIRNTIDGEENINEWDVLDIEEFKHSSTLYAIAHLYFNLSDDPEDQYWAKYKEYEQKFDEAFGLGRARIDTNDDGIANESEKVPINTLRWGR